LTARLAVNFAEMSQAELDAFVTRYGKIAAEQVAAMRKNKQTAKADALEKSIASIKKLVAEKKFAEAQTAIGAMQRSLR